MSSETIFEDFSFFSSILVLTDADLDYLKNDHDSSGLREVIWQMFRQWKEKNGLKATREWIATGLVYINRKELIDILKT